jgi:hypothetical protein
MLGLDAGVRIIVEKELRVEIELVLSKLELALDAPTSQNGISDRRFTLHHFSSSS